MAFSIVRTSSISRGRTSTADGSDRQRQTSNPTRNIYRTFMPATVRGDKLAAGMELSPPLLVPWIALEFENQDTETA